MGHWSNECPDLLPKKLAVIINASVPVTDSKENLEDGSDVRDLQTVKCISLNVKLDKGNDEVSSLFDSGSEANLISRGYAA